jgi:hypothetical protein
MSNTAEVTGGKPIAVFTIIIIIIIIINLLYAPTAGAQAFLYKENGP